jgi:hypothetical protein
VEVAVGDEPTTEVAGPMTTADASQPRSDPAAILLGYLNFSSGAFDPTVWQAMNELFAAVEPAEATGSSGEGGKDAGAVAGSVERPDAAALVSAVLGRRLDTLEREAPAFRNAVQARLVLSLTFEHLPAAYRAFHRDLLEHQPPGAIERPFFMAAAAQAILSTGGPFDDPQPVLDRAIATLNDYVGWRPVAVLENERLSEPYPHERVRPVPLFVAGAGVAHGRYAKLIAGAVEILQRAPQTLANQADFDLANLEELALDPRAFDFLHPAASRPNYLFGLWDPDRIDGRGWYRRLVVQQATLEGIRSWSEQPGAPPAERLHEASAVLAGVLLMAAGLSGHGPGAIQAGLPLSQLLPKIAGYRDEFYRWLMTTLPAEHRLRLEEEMERLRQPFGGVRRFINTTLAAARAKQVESVSLASVFARLGRREAAERMARRVPAASARMASRVMSRTVAADEAVSRGDLTAALDLLGDATELLFRAVGCGAAVDPWNILGLGGQFPLHDPGGESLPDPRVEDLVSMTAAVLEGSAAAWRTAALAGKTELAARAEGAVERLAGWWDRHATTTVSGVSHLSGREILDSTRDVIRALERRRAAGPEAPPAGFWRKEVAAFTSTRSHAEAASTLIREGDLDAAMGLIVHWASLLEGDLLARSGDEWLHAAEAWIAAALNDPSPASRSRQRRFLELVEANTSGVADLIELVVGDRGQAGSAREQQSEDDDDVDESVAAAYETMVWRDSADDGVEGGMLETDTGGHDELAPLEDVEEAAEFLAGVARLVRTVVIAWSHQTVADAEPTPEAELESAAGWRHALRRIRNRMVRAAAAIGERSGQGGPMLSAGDEDRLRLAADAAAERLLESAVQLSETLWMLAAHRAIAEGRTDVPASGRGAVGVLFAAMLSGNVEATRVALEHVQQQLMGRRVLYVPLSRGGRPDKIVAARRRERLLERLAACLPRLGLVQETIGLVRLAKSLERHRPPGAASVSEFDRVFEAATTSLVERICESAGPKDDSSSLRTERILEGVSQLVPRLLETWMTHARQLRLSVLERMRDDKVYAVIRDFVERYGGGLFTQHLMAPTSLRGILRRGVRPWLEGLLEKAEFDPEVERLPLLNAIASGELPLRHAAARVRLVLESIAENHAEYRDWNSTTSQSDRGEYLHILLDFLRIKAEYDRISWTLRPVGMAHRVLARRGESEAAKAWRLRMREETAATSDGLRRRLAEIESTWGLRLASVADCVQRPFTAVLEQDELESLVEPAVMELRGGGPAPVAMAFEERAESFLGLAAGSGVEVPEWLEQLGRCVDAALEHRVEVSPNGRLPDALAWQPIEWSVLEEMLAPPPGRDE